MDARYPNSPPPLFAHFLLVDSRISP
jgi:hypothetical protein